MNIIFVTDNKLGSIFIRWFTWSNYSHVALMKGDTIIEATLKHGVVVKPLQDFMKKYKRKLICEVEGVDEEKAWNFALDQCNKPYDVKAIFGFLLRRNWTDDNSWFCSELVAASLLKGGVSIVRKDASRVTPEDILNSPLVKIVG